MEETPTVLRNPLSRLRDPSGAVGLNEIEQRIYDYLERLKADFDLEVLDKIDGSDGIFPVFDRFQQFRFRPGLYVVDNNRLYTPIDTGHYGLCLLVSVPRETTPVYAATLFQDAKIFYGPEHIIIFVACRRTATGIRFLSDIRNLNNRNVPVEPSIGAGVRLSQAEPAIGANQRLWTVQPSIVPVPGIKPLREVDFLFGVSEVRPEQDLLSDSDDDDDNYDDFVVDN